MRLSTLLLATGLTAVALPAVAVLPPAQDFPNLRPEP